MQIKVITLWQPWASLVMLGLKKYETRSWSTSHRGTLGIHAAKKQNWYDYFQAITRSLPKEDAMQVYETVLEAYHNLELPTGCILGTVDLRDVHSTTDLFNPTNILDNKISMMELMMGDYSPGRYAWELHNPKLFPEPVPIAGKQGLWNWEGGDLI